jgi:GNAT superfamily N-acetyltransferase
VETDFITITPGGRSGYRQLVSSISEAVWPEFMLHDDVAAQHWDGLFEDFSAFQFALITGDGGEVAALANSVPLRWDGGFERLPDEGWDWALIKSVSDLAEGLSPNMLCGLQISLAPEFQGRGLSDMMLGKMVDLARASGLQTVILPVRPSLKHRYPLTPIDSYIEWVDETGLPFDPWLRVHVRRGGRIVKACHMAMRIEGTAAEWREWTSLAFPQNGEYIVPGALVPILMDVEHDLGLYFEPNVWVVHPTA